MVQIWSRNRNRTTRQKSKPEPELDIKLCWASFPGWHADQTLSVRREGDHRGRGARSLRVLNHLQWANSQHCYGSVGSFINRPSGPKICNSEFFFFTYPRIRIHSSDSEHYYFIEDSKVFQKKKSIYSGTLLSESIAIPYPASVVDPDPDPSITRKLENPDF